MDFILIKCFDAVYFKQAGSCPASGDPCFGEGAVVDDMDTARGTALFEDCGYGVAGEPLTQRSLGAVFEGGRHIIAFFVHDLISHAFGRCPGYRKTAQYFGTDGNEFGMRTE